MGRDTVVTFIINISEKVLKYLCQREKNIRVRLQGEVWHLSQLSVTVEKICDRRALEKWILYKTLNWNGFC